MPLPNFLIIGAPKAGTTSLYRYLEQHPQVYVSSLKEPHFFSFGEMDPADPAAFIPPRAIRTARAYDRLFNGVRGETAVGEASTTYLASRRAADRIAQRLPGARLIAVLRQPAERAYSSYLMHRQLFGEEAPTFEAALEKEQYAIDRGIRPRLRYRSTGYYYQHLSYYYGLFPKEQVRVLLHEDLRDRPLETLKEIFGFLQVDDAFVPDVSLKYNVSGIPRNSAVTWLLRAVHPLRPHLVSLLPARMVSGVGQALLKTPRLEPETRATLCAHFRDEILKLQELVHRDLSHWLK